MTTSVNIGMGTLPLRSVPTPSRTDVLLDELVTAIGLAPADAHRLQETRDIPRAMRRIIRMATHVGQSWTCWQDSAGQVSLVIAEMPPQVLWEKDGFVGLDIDRYAEDGELVGSGRWLRDQHGTWRRWGAN
ncbi:MAG TPA: hypothetical protein VME21_18240 [Steroidobacteraceae bacterium]|nr:hypothetical protein [Steroidobacteraceae bacterium]